MSVSIEDARCYAERYEIESSSSWSPSIYLPDDRLSDRRLFRFEIPRLDKPLFLLRRFFGCSPSGSGFMFFLFPLVVA